MMDRIVNNKCVRCTLRVLRWVPVLFVFGMICWVFYAFGYELCYNTLESNVQRGAYMVVFAVLMFMFLWSYLQTVCMSPGHVPSEYVLGAETKEDLCNTETEDAYRAVLSRFVSQRKLHVTNRAFEGGPRFCIKCNCIKPDRSHHCSVCGHCILKFDHHCPWVNNCVCFHNYKFFVLFLGYGFYLCAFGFFAILPYFLSLYSQSSINIHDAGFGRFHVLFLFFVSAMFGIALGCLFFYHLYLTARNQSTVESFRPPVFGYGLDRNGYNLGIKRNFRQVFGEDAILWFIPIFTSLGEGATWKTKISCDQMTFNESRRSLAGLSIV